MKSTGSIVISFVLGLLLLHWSATWAQGDDTSVIKWQPEPLLTYTDFMAKAQNGSEVAMTSSGFYFQYQYNGREELTVELYATFDKSKSWFKPEGKVPEVLAHEQCHFDITELYVRKLRQQLANADFKKKNDFQKQLTKMFNDNNSKCAKAQRDYDAETKHGIDKEEELKWQKKVALELNELDAYRDEKFVVEVQ